MKFHVNNRKYLGSKYKLMPMLFEKMNQHIKKDYTTLLDLFGGTGSSTFFFQNKNFEVIINDFLVSNFIIYNAFFGSQEVCEKKIKLVFEYIKFELKPINNWFTKLYKNKYFSNKDIEKIAAIREFIKNENIYSLNEREKDVILASLLFSSDRAANSMGHYDVYIKREIMDKFEFKLVDFKSAKVAKGIYCEDANKLIKEIKSDILYLDPPYNSRQYSNLYHILETLVNWKEEDDYYGVALKSTKSTKSSDYSTSKAKESMLNLILNADTKMIAISYNNFDSNNSRSESKIKLDELILMLETRGKVSVYEIPYKMYASNNKKSNVTEYNEVLLVCDVKNGVLNDQLVKYPLNYMGGKFKYINNIISAFPKKINYFYDLFAGGANVAINVNADNIIINEIEKHQFDILNVFKNVQTFEIIKQIENIIFKYDLTYSAKDRLSKRLSDKDYKDKNENKYLKLRSDYNSSKNIYMLMTLIIYSFNNSINFNLNDEFNIPIGKRDLNKNIFKNILLFSEKMKLKNITLLNKDYEAVEIILNQNTVIYLDPPYLVSFAHYNKKWNDECESRLIIFIEKNKNIYLSNSLKSGSKINSLLKEFIEKNKNNIIFYETKVTYDNSWYHKLEKGNEEIFIKYK